LNLPEEKINNGTLVHSYDYSAGGQKLKQTFWGPSGMNAFSDYLGIFEFSNGSLSKIHFEGGFYQLSTTNEYNYFIKDHLGNVRIVFQDTDSDGKIDDETEVLQENHYYPNGLKFGSPANNDWWLGSADGNEWYEKLS